jgi:hypothetical protein
MPIRVLLQQDHSFAPDEVEALTAAFEDTLRRLRLAQREDPVTLTVARLILELAKRGERDPVRLREGVLAALGR